MDERKPDLVQVMERAGVEVPVRGGRPNVMARCPFHNDQGRPNMSVSAQSGLWYCFRCNRGGDVYDFQGGLLFGEAWNNRDPEMFREALGRLELLEVRSVAVKPPRAPKELSREIVQVLGLASRVYHLALMGEAGGAAREYLRSRRIDVPAMRRFRLGLAPPGALLGALAGYPAPLRQAAGLFLCLPGTLGRSARDGARELLAGRVIFPDVGRNGAVLHMIGRSQEEAAHLRYLSLSGLPKTIWGLGSTSRGQPVILTESVVDAINLRQMGFQGTAAGGTGIAGYLLPGLRRVPVLAILPQNDQAGVECVERWKRALPRARLLDHPFAGDEKDLNDQVRRHGLRRTAEVIRRSLAGAGIEIKAT